MPSPPLITALITLQTKNMPSLDAALVKEDKKDIFMAVQNIYLLFISTLTRLDYLKVPREGSLDSDVKILSLALEAMRSAVATATKSQEDSGQVEMSGADLVKCINSIRTPEYQEVEARFFADAAS